MRTAFTLPFIAAASLLAGCASQIAAPSLGPRAVEKQPIDMPVTNGEEPQEPADPALIAKIAAIVASAEAGDREFIEQRGRAEVAITKAARVAYGSEIWIAAQQALTALDSARGKVRDAGASVEALREDPANAAPGNRAAIDQAAARIADIDRVENMAFGTLSARLN